MTNLSTTHSGRAVYNLLCKMAPKEACRDCSPDPASPKYILRGLVARACYEAASSVSQQITL